MVKFSSKAMLREIFSIKKCKQIWILGEDLIFL